jgi:hypothetical protein
LDKIFDDAFRQANETFGGMRPAPRAGRPGKDERS